MLIIILVSVLVVGAIVSNLYASKKNRKPAANSVEVPTLSISEILKDIPKGPVEEAPVVEPVKEAVKQVAVKMDAKPKKKVIKK